MRVLCYFVFVSVLGLGASQAGGNQRSQADPCTHQHNVIGDVTHCDRYWECIHGVAQLYDCPNGLVFVGRNRGIAEGCDYPWRAGFCSGKTLANPPISTEHCDWLYGIFGHETSCTRYWTCWNGTATEQFCIGGLLYNEETHACDWPQNVVGCQKHPLCKEDANANVPLGQSCERYWSCQGGYPRLQRCPATLVFDRLSRRCVAPPTADCDVPSTTPAPVQEDPFRSGGGPARGNRPSGQKVRQRVRQQVQQQSRQPVAEQIFDDNQNQVIDGPVQQALRKPQAPRSSLAPTRPRLPALPSGAIPISFNAPRPFRPAPIADAIPLN